MTRSNDEDPLQRLRAADPAAGSSAPDHRSIRAAVDRQLAETGGPGDGAPVTADRERAAGSGAGRDDLSARRRRRKPLRYAAAAVGAVLLLGGGYAAGSGAGGLTAGSTADVAARETEAGSAGSDRAAPEAAPEIGTAPEDSDGPASGSGQEPASGPQRTVFTAGDLPEGPAQAPVYALEVSTSDADERVAQLAVALQLTGEPQEEDGTWVVGSGDSSSPVLRLHPTGTFEYADPSLQPWECLPVEPQTAPGSSAHSAEGDGQSAAADCADTGVPAPPDAAETFAAFLTDAGLDPEQYEIGTDDSGAGSSVTATLRLGGLESDLRIAATIVPGGIAAVEGTAATPIDLGEYPLISPAEAVERLMDPRFAGSSDLLAPPSPGRADDARGVVAGPDPQPAGPAPSAGSPVPWPVRQVQITTAELTLVSTVTAAGVLVLPAYQLTGTSEGAGTDTEGAEGIWTVPALTEDDLDFTG